MMLLKTQRLNLRQMNLDDQAALLEIFSDPEMMRFYPKPFDASMTQMWTERNMQRYEQDGFGLWAVLLKESGQVIGDCGLLLQKVDGTEAVENGYHIRRDLFFNSSSQYCLTPSG